MGISVSYTGGGRQSAFSIDGVPASGSVEAEILGAAPAHPASLFSGMADAFPMHRPLPQMPEFPSMSDDADKGKVKMGEGDTTDFLERKLSQTGSLAVVGNQMMLKGDNSCSGGKLVYGSNEGSRGFFSIRQIDPYNGGTLIDGKGDIPNTDFAEMVGQLGVRTRIGGRTVVNVRVLTNDKTEGEGEGGGDGKRKTQRYVEIKEFYRIADITPNGRIVKVSEEIEQPLSMFEVGSGSGSGKYGVRPFFDPPTSEDEKEKPHLVKLAFGAEADLDTWNEEKERFDCNYDDSGMLLEDPPVKIVETAHCAYAPEDDGSGNGEEGEE